MHQLLANATFRIVCGNSSGSGFSYRSSSIVVSNHHVIEPALTSGQSIVAICEDGTKIPLKLIGHSDKSKYDFALLQIQGDLPSNREILYPDNNHAITRGRKIMFAGFPHGIHDLLVHEAIVSAPSNTHAFYVDGSVNGGNSGGPIIDQQSGQLVGIVTQRRFLGVQDLQALQEQVNQLSNYCNQIASQGSVILMGINFGQFAGLMANGLNAMSQVVEANANSGIGIGFRIEFVDAEYSRIGLP